PRSRGSAPCWCVLRHPEGRGGTPRRSHIPIESRQDTPFEKHKSRLHSRRLFVLWFQRSDATCSGQLVELHSHGALLVSGIVLVQQTLGSSLIHGLNGHLISG